jgi:hypothetical protein
MYNAYYIKIHNSMVFSYSHGNNPYNKYPQQRRFHVEIHVVNWLEESGVLRAPASFFLFCEPSLYSIRRAHFLLVGVIRFQFPERGDNQPTHHSRETWSGLGYLAWIPGCFLAGIMKEGGSLSIQYSFEKEKKGCVSRLDQKPPHPISKMKL